MDAKHCNVAERLLGIAGVVHPGIDRIVFWMPREVEDFYDSIPDRFSVENLFIHQRRTSLANLHAQRMIVWR